MTKTEQKEVDRYLFHDQLPRYKAFEIDSKLRYFKPHTTKIEKTFAEEISSSLDTQNSQKSINPKFFYDDVGSDLFEQICTTPEYYLTRAEISILENIGNEIGLIANHMNQNGNGNTANIRLVELGSGASIKTRIILDALSNIQNHTEYVPIDISDILIQSSERLLADYTHLNITGIIDTYEGGLEFLRAYDKGPNLIIFLGSSYGNLSPADGVDFLRKVRSSMKPGDLFLMGLDMVKNVDILESAYNDSARVTARFNLNVLARINAELDADFELENFEHHAAYNHQKQRIEMHLKSLCEQTVIISNPGIKLHLKQDEMIHTENSYKYKPHQIQEIFSKTGLKQIKIWTDKNRHVAIVLAAATSSDAMPNSAVGGDKTAATKAASKYN